MPDYRTLFIINNCICYTEIIGVEFETVLDESASEQIMPQEGSFYGAI